MSKSVVSINRRILRFFLLATGAPALALGFILLSLNVLGMLCGDYFFYHPPKMPAKFEKTQDLSLFDRQVGEPVEQYLDRLAATTKQYIFHYYTAKSEDDDWFTVAHRLVPPTENWILYSVGMFHHAVGNWRRTSLEFYDPLPTLRRGYGFCSQYAAFTFNRLRANDIPVRYIGLHGHVVVEAQLPDGAWRVVDSDFGIAFPYSLAEIKAAPEIIVPEYQRTFIKDNQRMLEHQVNIFSGKGGVPHVLTEPKDFAGQLLSLQAIQHSYKAKWYIPALLVLCGAINLFCARRLKSGSRRTAERAHQAART